MISYSGAYFIRKTKYLGGYIEQMGFVGRGNFAILLQALLCCFKLEILLNCIICIIKAEFKGLLGEGGIHWIRECNLRGKPGCQKWVHKSGFAFFTDNDFQLEC